MSLPERIRTVFRLFLLFAVLVSVALISFITTVRISIRGRQEPTPQLVGMPLDKALRVTSRLGIELKIEDKVFSTQYPGNVVVSQIPPQGTRIKAGQHVHVLVSLGRPTATVPKLTGASVRVARISAIQRGLTVGDVAAVHWPGAPTDQVVAQDPSPAAADVRSPAVDFLVSLGESPPAFLCPSFVGKSLVEARRAIEKAGFKVGQVSSVATSGVARGAIVAQVPPVGTRIDRDTVFSFQVAEPARESNPSASAPATPTPKPDSNQ